MSSAPADKMPPGIPYIVANELAERFCYYGINAILAVYMTQHLQFGQAKATEWQSLFKFAAYFFPLIGAILSDVFWGKYRTIMTLAIVYTAGCAIIALDLGPGFLALGLGLMAFGTGGIKPCVSTNVGDQFTSKNQHLIERAFSIFYLSINIGATISIYFCPIWLEAYGPKVAFGVPAAAMALATVAFRLGRDRFVVVPPAMSQEAGKGVAYFALALVPVLGITAWVYTAFSPEYRTLAALMTLLALLALVVVVSLKTGVRNALPAELRQWMEEAFTGDSLRQIAALAVLFYLFVAMFFSLWEQSNGQTWTLQATSDLMDKHLFGFLAGVPVLGALAGYEMLASQVQVVNGLLILLLIPVFTFIIYPIMGKFFVVTPLRKIGIGMWVIASSYLIIAMIEERIMNGITVSLWWQILAYVVLTAAEILVSITALEFSYRQAPLKLKSFIMAATYLCCQSVGNAFTAQVNSAMVKPLPVVEVTAGSETWVKFADVSKLQQGQKIDFEGETGLQIADGGDAGRSLNGTFLIAEIDAAQNRARLADTIHRAPVATTGSFATETAQVSTYKLVGPDYFLFFAGTGAAAALGFMLVAGFYRDRSYVRASDAT